VKCTNTILLQQKIKKMLKKFEQLKLIEEKNEILIGQNLKPLQEMPIQESILPELVEYWTQY
jgi:hypothetical protein